MTEILLAACGGWVWVYKLQVYKLHKSLERKPFACAPCMSGWFCLALSVNQTWYHIPFLMCAAMIVTIVLSVFLNKL